MEQGKFNSFFFFKNIQGRKIKNCIKAGNLCCQLQKKAISNTIFLNACMRNRNVKIRLTRNINILNYEHKRSTQPILAVLFDDSMCWLHRTCCGTLIFVVTNMIRLI